MSRQRGVAESSSRAQIWRKVGRSSGSSAQHADISSCRMSGQLSGRRILFPSFTYFITCTTAQDEDRMEKYVCNPGDVEMCQSRCISRALCSGQHSASTDLIVGEALVRLLRQGRHLPQDHAETPNIRLGSKFSILKTRVKIFICISTLK